MSQANSHLYQSRQLEIEITKRDQRIRQLERLNATLSAEIDRMRPVVEVAQGWAHGGASKWLPLLAMEIVNYEQASQPK